jgi:hypothetical protein
MEIKAHTFQSSLFCTKNLLMRTPAIANNVIHFSLEYSYHCQQAE